VAAAIRALGRKSKGYVVDVTAPGELDQLADTVQADFGGIQIWVNNAGGLPDATPRYLTRTPDERWDAQMDLNLKAVWSGSVAAARHMKDSGGAIINTSSRAAFGGHIKNGPYAAAKAAVNSLTQTLAIELAPTIRVNAIGPGPIRTQNFDESIRLDEEKAQAFLKTLNIPLARYGTPDDIGAAAVFLASPAASWITGQCLFVTGGT
jgi:7-alpha-hydroxysteroid dehydrogenase